MDNTEPITINIDAWVAKRCAHPGCDRDDAGPCFLPDDQENPHEWLCADHAEEAGYCRMCGLFWGGTESFEFIHPGYCDNCQDQIDAEDTYYSDDEPDFSAWPDDGIEDTPAYHPHQP